MKKTVAVILSILVFALCGCNATGYKLYTEVPAFSDDIVFSARIMSGRADYAYKRMKEVIEQIDAQVSLTKSDSDLSRFNRAAAGERVQVGEHCYKLAELAIELYSETDGAFNAATAPLSRLWHVDAASLQSIEFDKALPTYEQVQETLSYCTPQGIICSVSDGNYYLEKTDGRTELDFGGLAKGYAVDKCVEILDEYAVQSALIDISGNVYFYGDYVSNTTSDWNVGVVAPRPRMDSRNYVCALKISGDCSAVTSGDYMRYYEKDGVYIPHIIGRDGVPIGVEYGESGWGNSDEWVISATVIGESSAVCDAMSTAVSVMGLEQGRAFLQNSELKGLIFTEKRYTIISSELYNPDKYDGYKSYERYEP